MPPGVLFPRLVVWSFPGRRTEQLSDVFTPSRLSVRGAGCTERDLLRMAGAVWIMVWLMCDITELLTTHEIEKEQEGGRGRGGGGGM